MDEQLHIRTSTGVGLDFELASLGDRVMAWFIDALIIVAYLIIVYFVAKEAGIAMEASFIIPMSLPAVFYHFLSEVFMNGQSIGKRSREIQVVRLDGEKADIGNYAMRALVSLLEIFLLQGSIAILFIVSTKYGQRLGDLAGGTTVVKTKKQSRLEDTLFREVNEAHEVVYSQAIGLSNEDAETLGLLLMELKRQKNSRHLMIMVPEARRNICERLQIEPHGNDLDFLHQLLNDYNFLQSKA